MGKTILTALLAAALVGVTALTMAAPALLCVPAHVFGRHLLHGALGQLPAIVGSALVPREVYVAPPAPAYTRARYGPPAWTPDWYSYCYSRYRSFNPNTGTFIGYDGYEHFCR